MASILRLGEFLPALPSRGPSSVRGPPIRRSPAHFDLHRGSAVLLTFSDHEVTHKMEEDADSLWHFGTSKVPSESSW